jgi:hypothetical protein
VTSSPDKEPVGLVDVTRFSKGGSFIVVRERDDPTCVHDEQGEPVTAKAGDFLVCGWRRGLDKWPHHAVDQPVVIPQAEYKDRIWPTVLRLLKRYKVSAPYRCCYREPSWSLQRYSAHVETYDDGTCRVYGMRGRGGGAYEGDGKCLRLKKDVFFAKGGDAHSPGAGRTPRGHSAAAGVT